ncbi:MAG: hypothetical protein HY291_24045 [Planctomycetes bacterium]|nr:hypothetical protein [Planctomycetota bacterium]
MNAERERVAKLIKDTFSGVTLGSGVGLWQGQALDDYADERTISTSRSRDEKMNWMAISADDLNRCQSSLSFFDAEGMRFHLPAFLLAELEEKLWNGVTFHLTYLDDYGKSKFTALSDAQRSTIREFLLLFKDHPDFTFDRPQIERALAEFWIEGVT